MTIKEIRALTKLSQTKFAERYGMSRRAIQSWEEGKREPAAWMVALLERCVLMDLEEEEK